MSTGYEPELDGSAELDKENHTYFQELIGVLRWATEIGRVDILLEISLLSQYQACPREGHMEEVLRIFKFLIFLNKAPIMWHSDSRKQNTSTFALKSCLEAITNHGIAIQTSYVRYSISGGRDTNLL